MSKVGDKRPADEPVERDFTDDQIKALEAAQAIIKRREIAAHREYTKLQYAAFDQRNTVLKTIPGFWPAALRNHGTINILTQHAEDQKALSFLEEVTVTRDPKEHRAYSFTFHFATNPFFSDKTLTKAFTYEFPTDPAVLKEDEFGVSDAAADFDQSRDTEPSSIKINWKDPSKALTTLYPRVVDDADPDSIEDPGSFFTIFESVDRSAELESMVVEVYEDAIEYFFGRGENSILSLDDDSDDEEDDDSADEDIDLEKPSKKKVKN